MTAFSNRSEFDAWEPNWCGSCTKDAVGYAPDGVYCDILSQVMLDNEVPPQWSLGTDDLRDRYHCDQFAGRHGDHGPIDLDVPPMPTVAAERS